MLGFLLHLLSRLLIRFERCREMFPSLFIELKVGLFFELRPTEVVRDVLPDVEAMLAAVG